MKYLRLVLKILLGLVVLLVLGLAVSLSPVDNTPYRETDYYRQTRQRLAELPALPKAAHGLRAGWAKTNLIPAYTTPTGGYGVRRGKHWETVHDSVFVRTIVVDNGATTVAIIALDLLITPPTVTEQLKKRLPEVGLRWENVYLGAVHTHNSLGGWAPGLVGELFAGEYEARVVDHITHTILQSIEAARKQLAPVEVGFATVDATDLLYNRLNEGKPVDGPVRLLRFRKASGPVATLLSFAGHATVLDAFSHQILSRDYPGALVDRLEQASGGFVAFLAGAVGSTGPHQKGESSDDRANVRRYADTLAARVGPVLARVQTRPDSSLGLLTLPLSLHEPQARVSEGWRVRPWLFHTVYGDFPSALKALRVGPVLLVGTPCDFSGELVPPLEQAARQRGLALMVTSFNGGYVGYITPDAYYGLDKYETRVMNWFGPGNGAYFSELITGLISRFGEEPR